MTDVDTQDFDSLLAAHQAHEAAKNAEQLTRALLDAELVKASKRTTQAHLARMLGLTKMGVGHRLRFIEKASAR